jgi:hypothetical protein
MKKNSSKIIILFLLTIFLWSGVNFSFQKKEFIVTTEKAYGLVIPGEQPVVPTVTPTTGSTDATNCNTQKAAWQANPNNGNLNKAYTDCLKATMQMAAAESAAGQMYDNILTAAIKGLDIAEMLSESVLKTVLTVIASIYQFAIIPLLGVLVRIAAGCLDLALRFTLDSKNITNIDGAIQQTWMIIRNIFNITFIFILLYTAIRTILGTAGTDTKKMIANVVIAALLINFSLFITRILIDAGNVLAAALYNAATSNGASFTESLVTALGISALWGKTGVTCLVCVPFFVATAIQTIVLLSSFIILIYVTLLMVARTVVLIFLMAISPVGFMGDILPQVKEYSKKWRENLFGQIFIAPVFLLFYYLIVNISGTFTATGVSLTDDTKNYAGIFKFIIILVLLFAAVKITKKMAGEVGGFVEKAGMLAAGAAIGYATGGASMLLKGTVGRVAAKAAASNSLVDAADGKGIRGFASRMTLKGATAASKASFDIRNTESFKKGTGFVGDNTGVKVDYNTGRAAQKGGYADIIEKRKKEEEAKAKAIANTDNLKVDHWSIEQEKVDAEIEKRKAEAATNNAILVNEIQAKKDKLQAEALTLTPKEKQKIEKEIDDHQEVIERNQKLTKADLSEEEKMKLEEDIRKDMAKAQTIANANSRVKAIASNGTTANKRAAAVVRGFIKAINREKTDAEKQTDLLEEIKRNSKTTT